MNRKKSAIHDHGEEWRLRRKYFLPSFSLFPSDEEKQKENLLLPMCDTAEREKEIKKGTEIGKERGGGREN